MQNVLEREASFLFFLPHDFHPVQWVSMGARGQDRNWPEWVGAEAKVIIITSPYLCDDVGTTVAPILSQNESLNGFCNSRHDP